MDDLLFERIGLVFESAGSDMESLLDYFPVVAASLAQANSDYLERKERYQKNSPWWMDDDSTSGDVDNPLAGLGEYGLGFPRFFLYSYMISACSLFEYEIRLVHKVYVHFKVIDFPWNKGCNKLDNGLVDEARKVIETIGLKIDEEEETWKKIEDYFMVRNCIVHNNGLIEESVYPDKLMEYARDAEILPEHAELEDEPRLELSAEYCEEVVNTMHDLFEDLYIVHLAAQNRDEYTAGKSENPRNRN